MSLQVWLPLNGNLNNQGLATIDLNYTPTFVTPGKIGTQCLSSQVGWFSVPAMTGKKQMSFAYWVKINAGTTTNWLDTFSWYSTDGSSDHRSRQEFYYYNTNGNTEGMTTGVWYYNTSNSGLTQRNIGEWYHYAFTIDYSTGITQFFVNGTLWKTTTNANTNHYIKGTNFLLRESTLDCSINDFRLYDHILSKKEVEEISKGLVLHYKLDNNINQTNWLLPNFETTIVRASGNSFTDYEYYTDLVTSTETTYIVDFYAKGSVNAMEMDVYFRNSGGSAYALTPKQILTTDWQHYSLPLSGSPSSLTLFRARCYGGTANDIIYIRNMRLFSNNMPVRDTIVYDSSGYNHNGTFNAINLINKSAKYNYGIQFNGSSSYVKVNENTWMAQNAESITINVWIKTTSSWPTGGRIFSCTESGGFNLEGGNSGYWRFPIYVCTNAAQTTFAYKYDSNEIQIAALPINEWVMLTCVYDKTGTKTYINGELHHTYTNTSYGIRFNTNARLYLGCEANGANPSGPYYNGQMSDFRLYYTALTSEQILELYNTSATIDNNGNIYTRELVEI